MRQWRKLNPSAPKRSVPKTVLITLFIFSILACMVPSSFASSTAIPPHNMNTTRREHTATLLPNGTVLITGGLSFANTILNTAEIYDPSTGIFTPTGNMNTARTRHTAMLLSDGTVLIAGGHGNIPNADTPQLNTAEIYDPSTGIFTPTGNMNAAREQHTATLLHDGTVLIAGGTNFTYSTYATIYLNTAEIYNPSTRTFTKTTWNMNYYRLPPFTSTLLHNGKVLIAGDWFTNKQTEVYDASTGLFTIE